ncbi:MAG: HNH endonuclease [Actinobacteria bacterium]|nr:HNH endonuclease [Actinomycetota bacterium]
MTGNQNFRYRIGVDVGDRSVGLAAIAYDASGMPTQVLAAVSHIHDGGMDPSTGKSPQSRLATAGVARRARRLVRNRRKRLIKLDEVLVAAGIPVPSNEIRQQYEAWAARDVLTRAYVKNAEERTRLLSLAIRHMARHRGWRNPWWGYDRLAAEPSPSEPFTKLLTAAETRFKRPAGTWTYLGQLVSDVRDVTVAIRPRTGEGLAKSDAGAVISERLHQQDTLAELREILAQQRVPNDVAERICKAVFIQEKPHVPVTRIGPCGILSSLPRASSASLEFQEYRVRAAVANLRIKSGAKDSRTLTEVEHDLVVDKLLEWRDPESPRWIEVAEWLEVPVRDLKRPSIEDGGTSVAPIDRTSRAVEAAFKASSAIGTWWDSANTSDRAELVTVITDAITSVTELSGSVGALIHDWSEEDAAKLDSLKLDSGRCAYALQTLRQLNEMMREMRCDVYTARREAFGLPADWQPPAPTFDDPIEHPAVNRVNALVRRFLMTAVAKWGVPEGVVVEHVRSAFMGPTARAAFEYELRNNTQRRQKVRDELVTQGVANPSRGDQRRYESINRQSGICLYCGNTIGMLDSQLDHIIADSQGGSNRRDNLVAVCATCNSQKGKLPFAVWARSSKREGVSVEQASGRLRAWSRAGLTVSQFNALKRDVARRLGLDEDPEPPEDRSIESTAYAAREMRARIGSFLTAECARRGLAESPAVAVYSGSVTSQARRAGGVDDMMRLRGKETKDRFDRRHHAIDASVLTTLSSSVAVTLRTRQAMRSSDQYTGSEPGWKEFRGASPSEQKRFGAWITQINQLGALLKAAADADEIAVVRPLRLRPSVGAIHKATVEPLHFKAVEEAWSADDILRVCDRRHFQKLWDLANGGTIDADVNRAAALGIPDDVDLFPSNAAYVKVRGGAAPIGDTIQHARVYAWRTKQGFGFGVVRVYTGEFPAIGFANPGVNILTHPLPHWSLAIRTANATLRSRILAGEAREIGWLALDDEVEIDVDTLSRGDSKIADFLGTHPEVRWVLTGFFTAQQLSLAPSLLASEGIDGSTPEPVARILRDNRVALAPNVVLGSPSCRVVRRTVLGRPRWTHSSLPVSWSPLEEAEKAFSL